MSAEWSTATVVAILTLLGSGIAWVVKRRDQAKDPIPKAVAEATVAEQLTGAAAVLISGMQTEIKRISNECSELRTEHKTATAAIETLRQSDQRKGREIVHLRGEVRVLGEYAIENHAWIEGGMKPPPPKMTDAAARVVQRLREDLERQHVSHPDTD